MFSMPPAATVSASPSWIICEPAITAAMPDAHALLNVIAEVVSGMPSRYRGLPRRCLAKAGREHVAHHDVVDLFRVDPGPVDSARERRRAKLGRRRGRQPAAELADRRPGRTHHNNVAFEGSFQCHVSPDCVEFRFALRVYAGVGG